MKKIKSSNSSLSYEYEALDINKTKIRGEITAPSVSGAKLLLQKQGFTVTKIRRKFDFFTKKNRENILPSEVAIFTRQMATMLGAGIPIVQGISTILEASPSPALREICRKLKTDIESGTSLSTALRKFPLSFDELYCNLVAAGEQAGALDAMLARLAVYKERTESLKRKVKKAMYYPTAVIAISILVTAILLIKVVPTFKDMFKSFNAELPAFTVMILTISDFVINSGWYLLAGIIAGLFFLKKSYNSGPLLQNLIDEISLKLPIVGELFQKIVLARFARTLATNLAAGVPLLEALDAVGKASGNYVYNRAIKKIKESIISGQSLKLSIRRVQLFPPLVIQMIGIGEESGSLDSMLNKLAVIYEEEIDTTIDGLTTLLEPLVLLILGVVVGGLVVAMYLPIFKMGSII